jgi:CDGSH-type Zn-finger protein
MSTKEPGMNRQHSTGPRIDVTQDGPYLVSGGLPLGEQWITTNAAGESLDYRAGKVYPAAQQYALCRCGQSANKPYCDGTHAKAGFDGTETASRAPYAEQAETISGPAISLTDASALCAFARFCDREGQVWNLVKRTDKPDAPDLVAQEAGHCPGGRLVARSRGSNHAIEPAFEPSLGLIVDTARNVNGPIWVRGGVPVFSADGQGREVRNRMALCRCGRSSNKPFCDGSHAA